MDTKMQLLINPTDFAITQKQVRLKLYIQGNRLNIQSSDYIQGQRPIFINGGELQTLTNNDIAALFRLENLQGITAAQYAAPLPDGMYNFCFEMYDFLTNEKLSQKSCGMMYLQLNDPPILNIPAKNEQIVATDFPNILFNWTPRQINATNVSYKFELKQIIDPTLDPQIGFMMAPLLHEETVFSTALLYNLSMPILTPGMRYAWRVKAISTTGLSENAVFKNDGYSEIFSFKYATNCSAPNFLLSQAQSAKSAKITWQSQSGNRKFHVQYRTKGVAKAEWFSIYTQNDQVTLTNLEPALSYEFRVGATCEAEQYGVDPSYVYSNIQEFRMPDKSNAVQAYNCGIRPALKISNQTPLTNLIQSETFTAGDFPVTILELSGKSPYSGLGYVVVPYLADTKIAVEFNNIIINTDYQLINGIVETSYNPDWNNVADVEDHTGEGARGQIQEAVPFVISDIVINANGDIVVNGTNGEQVIIPGGKDTSITDGNGTVYHVDKNGNGSNQGDEAAKGGKSTPANTDGVDKNGQVTAFTAKGVKVEFTDTNSSKYAFDVMPKKAPAALEKLYRKVGDVALPYKAVVNGQSDTVLATVTITDTLVKPENIVFKTQSGAKVDFNRNNNVFTLTVKGNQTYAEEQIIATILQGDKWKVIGAFELVHISPKEVNVALVPTDKTAQDKLAAIIKKTQEIYDKVGIKVNFTTAAILDISRITGDKIKTEKNTLTSTYSTEQQKINDQYQGADNSYVLFVTEKTSSTGQAGYMRLNGKFGYVFAPSLATGGKTAAHELGHGIFKLEHPFELYKTTEKGTDLLMDYSDGTVLNHQDWKQINDPGFRLYSFHSQASGEYKVKNLNYICVNDFYNHKPTTVYYDLDGNKILLNSNYKPYAFVGEDQNGHKGQLAIIKNIETGKLFYPIDSKDGTEKHGYRGYDAYNKFSIVFEGFTISKKDGTFVYADSNCEYFENGKSLGVHEKCTDCAELPKSTGSSKSNTFAINELTFKLPDEYSVVASDEDELKSNVIIIVDNDRRIGREDQEDRQSHTNLVPSKNAENVYKEVVTLWNNYENLVYTGHLFPGVPGGNLFDDEVKKLDGEKLLMPSLIKSKVLDKVSEKFIQDFFERKIRGFGNIGLKSVSLYDFGNGNSNYEKAGSDIVQNFYKKTGDAYYKTKIIADAIYKTEKGKENINNMIMLVDQIFQYKMSKSKQEFKNNVFLDRPLDNDWFDEGINVETFPRFEVGALMKTDEDRLGLFCIGGTQAVKIGVKDFKPIIDENNIGYEAIVIIQYLDTFGVSESDYIKDLGNLGSSNLAQFNYRGGVLAQWILQHQYGYRPFNDYLTYNVKIKKIWKK